MQQAGCSRGEAVAAHIKHSITVRALLVDILYFLLGGDRVLFLGYFSVIWPRVYFAIFRMLFVSLFSLLPFPPSLEKKTKCLCFATYTRLYPTLPYPTLPYRGNPRREACKKGGGGCRRKQIQHNHRNDRRQAQVQRHPQLLCSSSATSSPSATTLARTHPPSKLRRLP